MEASSRAHCDSRILWPSIDTKKRMTLHRSCPLMARCGRSRPRDRRPLSRGKRISPQHKPIVCTTSAGLGGARPDLHRTTRQAPGRGFADMTVLRRPKNGGRYPLDGCDQYGLARPHAPVPPRSAGRPAPIASVRRRRHRVTSTQRPTSLARRRLKDPRNQAISTRAFPVKHSNQQGGG